MEAKISDSRGRRDAAKRKVAVAAQMKAQAQAEKDFDLKYKRCRKCTKLGKEMRSVSDLLKEIDTAKAKRVRSTSGEKVPVWAKKRFNWQANNWSTDVLCGSHNGGGREGYVASYEALKDFCVLTRFSAAFQLCEHCSSCSG